MAAITVNDVLRLALPPGTGVAAGAPGLQRQVTWVVTPRATLPAFANLRGGEIALVSLAALQALDDHLTLANLVERLAAVPISAIGVIGEVSDSARSAAEVARMPLLGLPLGADLREAEREVQRLISDHEAQLERRAAQFGNLLNQRSLSGAGLPGLLELLTERTGRGVACYTTSGELRGLKARGSARVALQTLRPTDPGANNHLGQSIWVQALGAGSERLGFLALAGDSIDEWDRQAAQQGATALALELAKEQAVQAAEERLRGDFVQSVLAGPPADSEALLRRGQELGYDLRKSHVALLCTNGESDTDDGGARITMALGSALTALKLNAPTMRRADGVLCYLPLNGRSLRPRDIAEQLRAQLVPDIPNVVVAIGKDATTVSAWPRSLREAEQALLLGRQLLDTAHVLDFGDLGVYRLLLLLRESPELWEFYRTTLAALTDYDRKQHAELLKTLEAFFANLGNLARAAEALHVHRNTLLYRLERITEISGLNLDDAEERLALWLALKAHRVLQTLDSDESL
ncbi:MAG: helix-turn-helix domain-containing protein [Chloroflexi bacterium SZAS-1]|jgi:purine catabolism regulator|nr:helix-turn-helix domain-containing protein [Chloroflexi bacterium SZAS-1]HNP88644.1 helix-turn-helix domain-containing protein [Kouleothrix sp.]